MNKAEKLVSPQVVGTVHSLGALRQALRLPAGAVDWLELRVDHFAHELRPLVAAGPRFHFPCVVTVRHPQEGGTGDLSAERREELYRQFLPCTKLIDIELRSAKRLAPLIAEARAQGVGVVLSHHYFKGTPTAEALHTKLEEARDLGADIFKIAARTSAAEDVARLLGLFKAAKRQALSVMGMGPLGKASRLLFARAGSVLNYGYLGEPQVSGQWPAVTLRQRLTEVLSES